MCLRVYLIRLMMYTQAAMLISLGEGGNVSKTSLQCMFEEHTVHNG